MKLLRQRNLLTDFLLASPILCLQIIASSSAYDNRSILTADDGKQRIVLPKPTIAVPSADQSQSRSTSTIQHRQKRNDDRRRHRRFLSSQSLLHRFLLDVHGNKRYNNDQKSSGRHVEKSPKEKEDVADHVVSVSTVTPLTYEGSDLKENKGQSDESQTPEEDDFIADGMVSLPCTEKYCEDKGQSTDSYTPADEDVVDYVSSYKRKNAEDKRKSEIISNTPEQPPKPNPRLVTIATRPEPASVGNGIEKRSVPTMPNEEQVSKEPSNSSPKPEPEPVTMGVTKEPEPLPSDSSIARNICTFRNSTHLIRKISCDVGENCCYLGENGDRGCTDDCQKPDTCQTWNCNRANYTFIQSQKSTQTTKQYCIKRDRGINEVMKFIERGAEDVCFVDSYGAAGKFGRNDLGVIFTYTGEHIDMPQCIKREQMSENVYTKIAERMTPVAPEICFCFEYGCNKNMNIAKDLMNLRKCFYTLNYEDHDTTYGTNELMECPPDKACCAIDSSGQKFCAHCRPDDIRCRYDPAEFDPLVWPSFLSATVSQRQIAIKRAQSAGLDRPEVYKAPGYWLELKGKTCVCNWNGCNHNLLAAERHGRLRPRVQQKMDVETGNLIVLMTASIAVWLAAGIHGGYQYWKQKRTQHQLVNKLAGDFHTDRTPGETDPSVSDPLAPIKKKTEYTQDSPIKEHKFKAVTAPSDPNYMMIQSITTTMPMNTVLPQTV